MTYRRREMSDIGLLVKETIDLPAFVKRRGGPVFLAAASTLLLLGLALRIVAAGGDLWLDEIWSLVNLRPLTSIDQVFWRINHDNNHFLNSAYLYLVGPEASPRVQRGLSIALGFATIAASMWVTAGRGRWTALVTGLLFAVSSAMVHFGSEARGYMGAILCLLLCIGIVERRMQQGGWGAALAVTVLIGCLSHMTMIAALAPLGLWVFGQFWLRDRNLVQVLKATLDVFLPAIVVVLLVLAGILVCTELFSFAFGGYTPFTVADFALGFGGVLKASLGVPRAFNDWLVVATTTAISIGAVVMLHDRRVSLYAVGILALPVAAFLLRVPNVEFPRYFLVCGAFALLLAGELIGRALEAGRISRRIGVVALAAIVAGNVLAIVHFLDEQRGAYRALVERIVAASGTYATNYERAPMMVDYFADRLGRRVERIDREQWCARRPEWFVFVSLAGGPERLDLPQGCLSYTRVASTVPSGLSGTPWFLYRRSE